MQTNGSLGQQFWEKVTPHHVYHAFLKGEFARLSEPIRLTEKTLIEKPDLSDAEQNSKRFALLVQIRGPLLQWIPCSTEWYLVKSLEETHLHQLLVIARCGWDSPSDRNELFSVAMRKLITLHTNPNDWATPILWGHTKEGPFTILEGNNRLVAYTSTNPRPKLSIPVYIGLSRDYCVWHYLDPICS